MSTKNCSAASSMSPRSWNVGKTPDLLGLLLDELLSDWAAAILAEVVVVGVPDTCEVRVTK